MTRHSLLDRAARSGRVLPASLLLIVMAAACGETEPSSSRERRVWEGSGGAVASVGLVNYERRELAQRLTLPACLEAGDARFRFSSVSPFPGAGETPPGLTNTFARLDRWRLWSRSGRVTDQPALFVTIRGSSGIVAEYERLAPDVSCTA